MSATVITLNKGRDAHLARLLEGLARGAPPATCVVVEIGDSPAPLPDLPFPVERVPFPHAGLPLAAARNAGRRAARTETLIFLDVDCIPSAGLVAGLSRAIAEQDGLICCEIGYLPARAVVDGWDEGDLDRLGQPHPVRVFPDAGAVTVAPQPGLFWSLAFAVRAGTYDRLGGFDELFLGYGAEDTDLAFRADAAGVPILFLGGPRAYHQHHPAYDPPLQHFRDIVANASRFQARHGLWPMDGWLDRFARLGLIAARWREGIVIRRDPTPEEMAAARLPGDRPF
ncbi:galactosyltransferase-related protein [Methylobacterium sp. J-088]|uniref:glycosyltransferase family 2 protein n=1 Tax=Methylobacterium sp. J-088 TaxID=2836664 RepID=UPI001FBBF9EB|nr:galactosyltransferase-related protein [Methylobacterium sp. J-088]MCJ2066627.1 galactosyltransferase-related protein [Methylobacterium sp. J-088]